MPKKRREVKFRGGGFVSKPMVYVSPIVFITIIALLEWGTRSGFISDLTLPRPSGVYQAFLDLYHSGLLFKHLVPSLTRLIIGSIMGTIAGISVGLIIGLFSFARAGLLPIVSAIFPIPKIALLPLFVIWFGIDEGSKYALIAFGVFAPMAVATYSAIDNVDRSFIRMGQSFGLKWSSIVRKIILPAALPGILSGLKIALAIAIILLVAAEMLGANYGIGAYILEAGSLYDLERLFAGVTILSILGIIINWLIGLLEKKLLSWRT